MARNETDLAGRPVGADPEIHDDDHPGESGHVGAPAVGRPGPEQQTAQKPEPGKEPAGIAGLVKSLFDGTRKVIEPKQVPVRLADNTEWQVAVESAVWSVSAVVDRLIENLPSRVEVAPSEEITTLQTFLSSGVARQLVGRQPDRLRLQITYRSDAQTPPAVYIGAQGVTTGMGREIAVNETIQLDTRAPVYAISDGAGARLDVVIEIGER